MDMKEWKKLLHENTIVSEGGPRRNPGEIWKKSGKVGAKNSAGDIQYFKNSKDAKNFAAGAGGEEKPKKEPTTKPKEEPKATGKATGKVDWEATLKKFKGKRKGIPGEIVKRYTNDHLKKSGFSDESIAKYTKASLTSGGAKKLSKKDQTEFGKFKRMRDKIQKQMYAQIGK